MGGVDGQVGHFAIQRIALGKQFFQLGARIAGLQQRAALVVQGAGQNVVDLGAQIDHGAVAAQCQPVFRCQNGATPGGQHDVVHRAQFGNGVALPLAKALLTFDVEDGGDANTGAFFDFVIRVEKLFAGVAGKGAANRGFAGTHQADQKDIACQFHAQHCKGSVGTLSPALSGQSVRFR
ncbi:hypothetical protein D3C85_1375860 [compost metagenome]